MLSDASAPQQQPAPEPQPRAAVRGVLWDTRRTDLHELLAGRDALCGELYRRAVDALSERPLRPAAMVIACHCLREFANRLPRALAEVDVPEFESDDVVVNQLRAAVAHFDGLTSQDEPAAPAGPTAPESVGESDSLERPLSPAVVADAERVDEQGVIGAERSAGDAQHEAVLAVVSAARALLEAKSQATLRATQMRAALVLGSAPASGSKSTVQIVKDALGDLERFRHPQGDDVKNWDTVSPDYFIVRLEVLEQVIEGRLGRFFDVVADLHAVLEQANNHKDEVWDKPEPEFVRAVLARLPDPQHRNVFFHGLHNPMWLDPLKALHVFDDPPRDVRDAPAGSSFQPWPQGDYLRTAAQHFPDAVATILSKVVDSECAWNVRELVVAVAGEVPASASLLLSDIVLEAIDDGRGDFFLTDEAMKVVTTLARGSSRQRKKAKRIAQSMLEPREDPNTRRSPLLGPGVEVMAGVSDSYYADVLTSVVDAFGADMDIFRSLINWLGTEQDLSGTSRPSGDISYIRRPSIADHPQNYRFDRISDTLIETVRDLAGSLAAQEGVGPVVEVLRRRPAGVLQRIELHLLAEAISSSSSEQVQNELLSRAAAHLHDPDVVDELSLHRELYLLAATTLPHLDQDAYQQWEDLVLASPLTVDELAHIASAYPSLDPERAVADFQERRVHRRLSTVGVDALRGRAAATLEELTLKYGVVEHPGFAMWREISGGGVNPTHRDWDDVTAIDAATLTRQDLEEMTFESPSQRDAWGRALGTAVAARPDEFTAVSERILELGGEVTHHFLLPLVNLVRRTTEAHEADHSEVSSERPIPHTSDGADQQPAAEIARSGVDWAALLGAFASTAVWHEFDQNGHENHLSWRWVRDSLCLLLEAGAVRDIPAVMLPIAIQLATQLSTDSDPTEELEQRYDRADMDPVSYAVNTVRPSAVRALLHLAAAQLDRGVRQTHDTPEDDTPEDGAPGCEDMANDTAIDAVADSAGDPAAAQALEALSRILTPHRDHSVATAAVLGERAAWLLRSAPAWFERHREHLLTPDDFGDVFITTAFSSYHPHLMLLEAFEPAVGRMFERVGAGQALMSGSRSDGEATEVIGRTLLTLYLWGYLELDHELIATYHAVASDETRAEVLKQLGRRFLHTDDLEADIRDRAMLLWDSRREAAESAGREPGELVEFEPWIRSGHFPHTWWIPRLKDLLETESLSALPHVGQDIEDVAGKDMAAAVDLLDALVRRAPQHGGRTPYDVRRAIPRIVPAALDSDDAAIAAQADALVNFLARHGGPFALNELADVVSRRSRRSAASTNTRQPPG